MRHNRIIRREFSKQAPRFGDKGLTVSSPDILEWIVDFLPLNREFRVLDVAAGTGHLGLAIAPHVREVFAIDNISFEEGTAERLPFAADCFDLVVSRLAIHHFENPMIQLREMVRVCKPHHRIGIIDLIAPADEGIASIYNDLERMRDPSHVAALSKIQLEKILTNTGLRVEKFEARDVVVDFLRWVKMTETIPETIEVLKEELMEDINDGSKTGMRPYQENGSLKFLQVWSIIIGTKISNSKRS
jgi:ubiquinone/menaquinone biosynthesis C-methylase UbiE